LSWAGHDNTVLSTVCPTGRHGELRGG